MYPKFRTSNNKGVAGLNIIWTNVGPLCYQIVERLDGGKYTNKSIANHLQTDRYSRPYI